MPSSIGYETPLSQTITSLPLANAGMTEEIVATSYLCVPQPVPPRIVHSNKTCASVRLCVLAYAAHMHERALDARALRCSDRKQCP
jgi:hypothetical protein